MEEIWPPYTRSTNTKAQRCKIEVCELDWELHEARSACQIIRGSKNASAAHEEEGLDAVIACDCTFNEALVEPFVRACHSLCGMRSADIAPKTSSPTLCIIAQQVRCPEVLELFLATMLRHFEVYRVRDRVLSPELSEGSGFTVHLAVLST